MDQVGVLVDGAEGPFVGVPVGRAADAVAGGAEVVGGQQGHQGGQVGPDGPAQHDAGAVQVHRGQYTGLPTGRPGGQPGAGPRRPRAHHHRLRGPAAAACITTPG
jgi:hypothetical protein